MLGWDGVAATDQISEADAVRVELSPDAEW
jgi:hypothetical protein